MELVSEDTAYRQVEATLIRIVTEFAPAQVLEKMRQDEGTDAPTVMRLEQSIADKARIVECPSCVAQTIIIPGIVGKCEYCDRLLD